MNTQKKESLNKDNTLQQQDSSSTQDKHESKYERTEIEKTPFTIIEEPVDDKESLYTVTMGKYKIDSFGTYTEAWMYCQEITWDKIIMLIGIIIQADREMQINKLEVVQ